MNEIRLSTRKFNIAKKLTLPESLARKMFFKFAEKLRGGKLRIIEEDKTFDFGTEGDLSATMKIHNKGVYADWVLGGSLGAGESYIRGEWDSPDLTQFVRLFARNVDVVNELDGGLSRIASPILRGWHWLNRNTHKGSRQNIEAHYDLGNDFFRLFLDESMMYSAAIFAKDESTLAGAQELKLKTICDKLQLKAGDEVLEIGSGWGALAIYAAENYDCHVTTTTLSKEQHKLCCERIKEKKLEDKVTVLLQDYRELTGTFDKLVSVEMVEAVGHEFLPKYFASCSRLLKENGLFLMQVITIPDQRYERARKDIDFIKRYVFPGSCIPSVQRIMNCVSKNGNLRLLDHSDHTRDYARTLKCWSEKLASNKSKVEEITSMDFYRMWQFYFSYCEGGFEEFAIGSAQMVFAKPHNKTQIG